MAKHKTLMSPLRFLRAPATRSWVAAAALALCLVQILLADGPISPPPLPWPSPAAMEGMVSALRPVTPGAHPRSAAGLQGQASALPAHLTRPTRDLVTVASRGRPLLAWPLAGPITSRFGPRWGRTHSGIDIGAPVGTPVGAAAAGVVKRVAWVGGYGYTVEIDHGGGVTTFYAHLSRALVRAGDEVEMGKPVGRVGETGRVTGPHLHFELRLDGEPVNPVPYLSR